MATDGGLAVNAVELARKFGDVHALRGVSFGVPRGSIYGLLGPNGAGKTTLFRILTGELRPDSGTAIVAGIDVARDPAELRRRIGLLFEMQNLYPRLSVRENLRLFAALYGVANSQVDQLLKRFELDDRARARVQTLSHGMRQKVLLARALLHQPEVLFLDEPTNGLDPNWSLSVETIIREVQRSGTTVVLATHQMETADALCDTISIVDGGKIVATDSPQNLKQRLGKRSLAVESGSSGSSVTQHLDLDAAGTADTVALAIRTKQLIRIHSEEATLDDVFRQLTGKSLSVTPE